MKRLLIILPLLVGATNIFGGNVPSSQERSKLKPQKLYVTNNIGFNRDLLVTWYEAGMYNNNFMKELQETVVKSGATKEIIDFDYIADGTITLEPTGMIGQYTGSRVWISKETLLEEFQKQSKRLADYFASIPQPAPTNLSIEVVVTQGWLGGQLNLEYKARVTGGGR